MNNFKTSKDKKKRAVLFNNEFGFNVLDIIFVVLFVLFSVICFVFEKDINRMLNNINQEQVENITLINPLKTHVLDVGQALSVVIELPDGKIMLYDAGLEKTKYKVEEYLKNNIKTQTIDYLIISHTDNDHVGGASYIIDNFKINKILRPITKSVHNSFDESLSVSNIEEFSQLNDELYAKFLLKASLEDCEILLADYHKLEQLNTAFDGLNYNIEFYIPTYKKSSESNDLSTVVTITYQGKTLMLTGDATIKEENNLIQNYSLPDIDYLIVAHHGSTTSSSMEFLEKLKPEYAYISVGKGNSFNHPSTETINKLIYFNVPLEKIYRTDNLGTVLCAFNGYGVQNYFNAYKIKMCYLYVGILIFILFLYGPKFKIFYKLVIVKKLRKFIKKR